MTRASFSVLMGLLILRPGSSDDNPSPESTCGGVEETISTDCLGDSLVKSQARATAKMVMGGSCTAWLVKAATSTQGALMLTTGHCATRPTANFIFDFVNPCGSTRGASPHKTCSGQRLSFESSKDEQGLYELQRPCLHADAATPILLDIGTPDEGEGMYLIGHPKGRPQELSHQEPQDDGHHCEVRQRFSSRDSKRISYYCDTQGGNSGSPVFSARTGYAFAIHSHGGCGRSQSSANSGGLLGNTGIVNAFNKFGISYVSRDTANLFKYEEFVEEAGCFDHDLSFRLSMKSLAQCKALCVNSLTCVGIEYSASERNCLVNFRSKTSSRLCREDFKYFNRTKTLTKTLTMYVPSTRTTTTTTTSTAPLIPASGVCGFESSTQPFCGIWRQNTFDDQDWVRKNSRTAHGGSYYMTLACTEVSISIDMKYDGSRPGAWGTTVRVMSNGMAQDLTFHPAYPGGAARALPGFGNQNMGFTPAGDLFHHVVLTLRKGGTHTFQIINGQNTQQVWSKDFVREGLFSGDVNGVEVLADPASSRQLMSPGQVYNFVMRGEHSMKLLSVPKCRSSLLQSVSGASLDALTPVLNSDAFLSFFYRMEGNANGALKVIVQSMKRKSIQELWSTSGDQGDQWRHQNLSLNMFFDDSVIISFLGLQQVISSTTRQDIAIDDVVLSAGHSTVTTVTTTPSSSTSTTHNSLSSTTPLITTTTTASVTMPHRSITTTSISDKVDYYIMPEGSCCCPVQERILTTAACRDAHDALGLHRHTEWKGRSSYIPGGCSTRQDRSHDLHWNALEPGRARSDMSPVCKKKIFPLTTTIASPSWTTIRSITSTMTASDTTTSTDTTTTSAEANTPATTTSTKTATGSMSSTSHLGTTTTSTTQTKLAPTGISSGDTVFLRTRLGNHLDVEGVAVRARWHSHGTWQALTIEKKGGGSVHSGDVVYFQSHTGAHLDVFDGVVQARWEDRGTWQSMVIEKKTGSGLILPDDAICLKAHTDKHLDVEGDVVMARWNECGDWQAIIIEKEAAGALSSGDSIRLLAHTQRRVEVENVAVHARWSDRGLWQTFTVENHGGRAIYSGDRIFLKAHTSKLLHVQNTTVLAEWNDYGAWQVFMVERKSGHGPVMPGDSIFLQAHTGRFVEVDGVAVKASWFEKGNWQTLKVEKVTMTTSTTTVSTLEECKSWCADHGYCCTRESGCGHPSCVVGCEIRSMASSIADCMNTCESFQGTCFGTPHGYPTANFCTGGTCQCYGSFGPGDCEPDAANACAAGCMAVHWSNEITTTQTTTTTTQAEKATQRRLTGALQSPPSLVGSEQHEHGNSIFL